MTNDEQIAQYLQEANEAAAKCIRYIRLLKGLGQCKNLSVKAEELKTLLVEQANTHEVGRMIQEGDKSALHK